MKFSNPYLKVETKIRMLQRWILVQSYIYYNLNDNIVKDNVYDNNTRELIEMQKKFPDIKTEFSYVFNDFVSGTGFDLISRLNDKHLKKIERDAKLALANKKLLIIRTKKSKTHGV